MTMHVRHGRNAAVAVRSATQSLVPPTQEAVSQCRASVQGAHRRPASAIDFDFYRAQAVALRRRAMHDAAALKAASAIALAVIGLATFVILVASAAAPSP